MVRAQQSSTNFGWSATRGSTPARAYVLEQKEVLHAVSTGEQHSFGRHGTAGQACRMDAAVLLQCCRQIQLVIYHPVIIATGVGAGFSTFLPPARARAQNQFAPTHTAHPAALARRQACPTAASQRGARTAATFLSSLLGQRRAPPHARPVRYSVRNGHYSLSESPGYNLPLSQVTHAHHRLPPSLSTYRTKASHGARTLPVSI
jgi:hypothetical protein